MAAPTGRYAVVATCPHCDHAIVLTSIFTHRPTRDRNVELTIDTPALQRAVAIHLDHCGDHP